MQHSETWFRGWLGGARLIIAVNDLLKPKQCYGPMINFFKYKETTEKVNAIKIKYPYRAAYLMSHAQHKKHLIQNLRAKNYWYY